LGDCRILGSPIAVNDNVYFYDHARNYLRGELEGRCARRTALVAVNDLGPSGETWSLNTPSYSGGRLYHRTLKEVIAIANNHMMIDAHHHLWKYSAAEYGWISPEMQAIRRVELSSRDVRCR